MRINIHALPSNERTSLHVDDSQTIYQLKLAFTDRQLLPRATQCAIRAEAAVEIVPDDTARCSRDAAEVQPGAAEVLPS